MTATEVNVLRSWDMSECVMDVQTNLFYMHGGTEVIL